MEDKELFELCKQVYEKTGWDDKTLDHFAEWSSPEPQETDYDFPRYTSDYILEKLPKISAFPGDIGLTLEGDDSGGWGAGTGDGKQDLYFAAVTPLKALLKLTLALHEAGELK